MSVLQSEIPSQAFENDKHLSSAAQYIPWQYKPYTDSNPKKFNSF